MSPALFVAVAAAAVVLDQLAKGLVLRHLSVGEPVQVIGTLVQFTLTFNAGAAFSMGTTLTPWLTVLVVCLVVAIVVVSTRVKSLLWTWALALLLGGALGNLSDRMFRSPGFFRGHVVDFVQLPHWAVFNVADMCVVTAACLILFATFTGRTLDGRRLGARSGGR